MKPERWQEIERIFSSALDVPPGERGAFLEKACAGDDLLRKEVEDLLARQQEADGFFESPAFELTAGALRDESATGAVPSSILHYRMLEKIGEGGMGVVYRATDTRLNREVAIKILPEVFAADRERLARFEREAKLLASLNHPNIAAIHGLERTDSGPVLVMELVKGDTLAKRIAKGPLPVEEALDVCRQIAEGLEAAHEKGIVHRDLKPANVKITPEGNVKVLDFGLAKALADDVQAIDLTHSPTITEAMTKPGVILGTAAYMSPEQAKGKPVDKRGDIWALGCILFECLTGRRAFPGDTVSETIAAILGREPDWEALPRTTPAAVLKLLERSLRKNPHERMHDVADMRIEIQETLKEPPGADHEQKRMHPHLARRLALAGSMLLCVIAGIMLSRIWKPAGRNALPVERITISLAASGLRLTQGGGVAISPDGQKIVFPATAADGQRLYVRQLDAWEPRPLKGTEGAQNPVFSPGGQWVAFTANGKLLKAPLIGGPTEPICSASLQSSGGTWARDGRILFGQFPNAGIWRVAADGGQPEAVARPPDNGTQYNWPELLPGGNAILFSVLLEHRSIAAYMFRNGEVRPLIESGVHARYVPTGHLLYQAEGSLRAVPFDPDRVEIRGPSRLVAEGIAKGSGRGREYDVSATGTLVYTLPSTSLSRLVWKDRTGNTTPLNFNPRIYSYPALSPDGRKIAVKVQESTDGTRNVWAAGVEGEPMTRLSFGNNDSFSVFTVDSSRVFFTSAEGGGYNIFWAAADGSTKPEALTTGAHIHRPTSFSPDGKVLLLNDADRSGRRDIYILDVNRATVARPFIQTRFNELEAVFSPDGHYVAYQSNESGQTEVYVQPYPGPGAKVRISIDGGQAPAWNPRGGELFYESPTVFMAVRMEGGKPAGAPARLFARVPRDYRKEYDVSPDGQRFLMLESAEPPGSGLEINVITNWFEELKRLVPTK